MSEVGGSAPGGAGRGRLLFAATAVAAMVLLPLPGGYDVFDSSIFLVVDGNVQPEDAYVVADRGVVEGTIDGDLVIAAGELDVNGVVTGDVFVVSAGTVTVRGEVRGALRGAARRVIVTGTGMIGDDLAVAAVRTDVEGTVGRDAIVFGGRFDLTGSIGRDVRGRFGRGSIDGTIGRGVDVATSSLEIGPNAAVEGRILYRSNRTATRDPAASIGGQLTRASPKPSFFVDVWWTLATILGFLSFLLTGIAVFWLMRDTSARAVRTIVERPWRTLVLGVAVIVLIPVVVVMFVASLIGIPVAVLLGVLYLLGFFFGPIPAVAAAGSRIPGGRGGIFAAFLVGAIVWRAAIYFLSFVAGALYVLAVVWGFGGWASAVWRARGTGYSEPSVDTTART